MHVTNSRLRIEILAGNFEIANKHTNYFKHKKNKILYQFKINIYQFKATIKHAQLIN